MKLPVGLFVKLKTLQGLSIDSTRDRFNPAALKSVIREMNNFKHLHLGPDLLSILSDNSFPELVKLSSASLDDYVHGKYRILALPKLKQLRAREPKLLKAVLNIPMPSLQSTEIDCVDAKT